MYLEPILSIISAETKNCSLVGDFNIDLVKLNSHGDVNNYYNNLTNHFFAPYILQPTRPQSKTLIDNIFLNTMEYCSYSGNIIIQLSDHLFQFVLLEGYFHDIKPKKIIIKERNYKHFNEREFLETVQNLNIEEILCLDDKDPNVSITNLFNNINYLLDEFAPYKKLNKHEIKLKTKPWINKEIQFLMWERDKLFKKYYNAKDEERKQNLLDHYKRTRNEVTRLKRKNKTEYYKIYFEKNIKKTKALWKGIRSLVYIKPSNKSDISIIDTNRDTITDPLKISNCFNKYFVNVGSDIENKIPKSNVPHTDYLNRICINKSFYLKPAS